MRRRDLSSAFLVAALPGAQAVSPNSAPYFPRTPAEIARRIAPGNGEQLTHPFVDVRRYGAVGDGVTDDTDAIATAFSLAADSTLAVVFPYGYTFKITRYIEILSNTSVYLLGTVLLTDRASGLYANNASNIAILGFKVGVFLDAAVKADYRWNNFHVPTAPAVHLRSCRNVLIHGLHLTYCQQGILISNAAETKSWAGSWRLSQELCVSCSVQSCHIEFCEMSGIASFNALDTRYLDNYVYRCGDGGIWMMGARDCEVVGNHRVSPYASPDQVHAFGPNHRDHPGTWNDEQGLEFENCHGLLIANNVVKGLWAYGIDIKNVCNRVLVTGNRVSDCENASIVVRAGDGVKGACHKVSIVGNTVSNHGTSHYGRATDSVRGAIGVAACFSTEIVDNVIYSYRMSPGICCLGPEAYQHMDYPANPHQGSLVVSANTFTFKADGFENEHEISFDSDTPSAVVIAGQYDAIKVSDNQVSTDRHSASDTRFNAEAAIVLQFVTANGMHYPTSALISDNHVSGWGNWGILVRGLPEVMGSGLAVQGNVIASTGGGGGIHLIHTRRAQINGNTVNRIVGGSGYAGIWLEGSAEQPLEEALVTGNQIVGGEAHGNAMTYGLKFDYCADCNAENNGISLATLSPVGAYGITGDLCLTGTTGFPRSGRGAPVGSVAAYHRGELYWDESQGKWWIATVGGSTSWTPLSG